MKKWWIGAVSSIIIMPVLALSWANARAIWAAPEKVEAIEKKAVKLDNFDQQIAKLVMEQHNRLDKQEAVYQAQMQSIEKQVDLIADLKKKNR